jgi:predicted nucleotidyltransferase
VFVHGSYIRGEALPGDLDVVILAKVKDEWRKLCEAFRSLSECHDVIVDCYRTGMSLEDVFRGPLSSEIEKRQIPMEWIATMSWSELFGQTAFYIPYMLFWDRITRRVLTKGMKGIHIQFETNAESFAVIIGGLHFYREIPVFSIWSNESLTDPVLEPNRDEYEGYLKLEHEKLQASISDARFLKTMGEFLIEKSLSVLPNEKLGDVALQVLWDTPKYEASEETLREALRKFGIPENKVYAIKHRGTKTWYHLAHNEEEELKFKTEAEDRERIIAIEMTIQKILRKLISKDEASKVDCWILELKEGDVMIHVTKPVTIDQETFRKLWENRGFKVEDFGLMYARKAASLSLNSNKDKLSEEVRRQFMG